jgi:hypothetical protein
LSEMACCWDWWEAWDEWDEWDECWDMPRFLWAIGEGESWGPGEDAGHMPGLRRKALHLPRQADSPALPRPERRFRLANCFDLAPPYRHSDGSTPRAPNRTEDEGDAIHPSGASIRRSPGPAYFCPVRGRGLRRATKQVRGGPRCGKMRPSRSGG